MAPYNRWIWALIIFVCSVTCTVAADLPPPSVIVEGQSLASSLPPLVRDGQVWVSSSAISAALDIKLVPDGQVFNVTGSSATAARIVVDGNDYVSLQGLSDALGAYLRHVDNRVYLLAQMTSVRFVDGQLRIRTSLPIRYEVRTLSNPDRVYVNLLGVHREGLPSEARSETSIVRTLRIGQLDPTTARVVAETAQKEPYRVVSPDPAQEIVIALGEKSPAAGAPAAGATKSPPPESSGPSPVSGSPAGLSITDVQVQSTPDLLTLTVSGNRPLAPELGMRLKDGEMWLDFANAAIDSQQTSWTVTSGLIQDASLALGDQSTDGGSAAAPGTARLLVHSSRLLVSRIMRGTGPNQIVWQLSSPPGSDGKWQGKTVIIDPGHGGQDTGARGNGILEKDVNLAIALDVAEAGRRRGLNCVLTRDTDVFKTLKFRTAQIARCNADLFVSIHANSNGVSNSASGTEVYYHKQDPSSRALAQIVHDDIVAATGMIGRGARSDTRLYRTGLFVLRNSTVPAILVETGYVNNSRDAARLSDPHFQKLVARAIVDGILSYLGAPVNPQDQESPAGSATP